MSNPHGTGNRLLRTIPADELSRVLSISERVKLTAGQVLHDYLVPMDHVYFVETGLVSVAAKVGHEKFVEVWLIGSDGMAGVPVILGAGVKPLHRRTVQVDGQALRIRTREFREAVEMLPAFRQALHSYLDVVLSRASQSGACNANHSLHHRLARWLLVARSCLNGDDIPLTHTVLSELLGVRRASVTECLERFENQGLIQTKRGHIIICKSDDLADVSCDCFRMIGGEYEQKLTLSVTENKSVLLN
jgi:CRP-like cAMP-binding protein